MNQKVKEQLLRGADDAGKFYGYDEEHDHRKPADVWFQTSPEGTTLFVVFYTQACRWNRCLGCNLPSKMSANHVNFKDLMAQIDHLFEMPEVMKQAKDIRRIVVSNNGSVLDEDTFSSTALVYLLANCNRFFPELEVFSLETRPEYVDLAELEFLHRALKEGETPTQLEISVGFEVFDDHLRNEVFKKGLELDKFEDLLKKVAPFGFKVSCYFMQKPVSNMTDGEGIHDIQEGIRYLGKMSEKYGVDITMYLNPTYVARGTVLETEFNDGKYVPPKLKDVLIAVSVAQRHDVNVFVGLYDEGLAVDGGSFIREGDQRYVDALAAFNHDQDYAALLGHLQA